VEAGRRADLVVLEGSQPRVDGEWPPEELEQVRVAATLCAGEVVFGSLE